jgi:hypothetical protein
MAIISSAEAMASRTRSSWRDKRFDAFEPKFGFVGFFKHDRHLRGELGPGAGALSRSIVGRRGGSAPNKLFGDYPGFDSRNKIIDEIKDFIGELSGTIRKRTTLTYYVIVYCQMRCSLTFVVQPNPSRP